MAKKLTNLLLIWLFVGGLNAVALGQSCFENYLCEDTIVSGPVCSSDFSCPGAYGNFGSYSSFYSFALAECEDDYWFYTWEPESAAIISNPYQCVLGATFLGGSYFTEGGMWDYVGGVQSSVYTDNAFSVAQMDCLYNSQSYSGTDPCSGSA